MSAACPVDLTVDDDVIIMPSTKSPPELIIVDEDTDIPDNPLIQRPAIVSIEGIMGSGKTEMINALSDLYQNSPDVVVLHEPSIAWEQFRINGKNLLDLSYDDPKRFAFIFQLVFFLAIEAQLQNALIQYADKRVIVCERSILSARVVYTELTPELDRIRYEVYQTLFLKEGVGDVYPNHIILLDTEPRDCVGRTEKKNWRGEQIITLDYLQRCRRLHMEMKGRHSGTWSTIQGHPDVIGERLDKIMKIVDGVMPIMTEIQDPKPVTKIMSIEGNIGAGKSTFLNEIESKCRSRRVEGIRILKEPVDEWEKVTDGSKNILELFYEHPAEYGFPLQVLIGITTLRKILRELSDYPDTELILSERSIMSSKLVFAKMLHHDGFMDEIEEEVYQMIFDNMPTWLVPKVMLYLNTKPNTCLERIGNRSRKGENKITIEQLERCETYHKIMFEETRIDMETIDRDREMDGASRDWANIVIKWCRQLIQGDKLDHLEPFVEDNPESKILPLVTELRKGKLETDNELYLIKVIYEGLKFRFALIDQKLTTKRLIWEIEQTWPSLKGQDIYFSWYLAERNHDGECTDEDLNESLKYIETVDEQSVDRTIIIEVHSPSDVDDVLPDAQSETVSMEDGENL